MFTDTHTHLYLEEFAPSPADAVRRAIEAGVSRMIFPNVDASTVEPMLKLAAEFPENIRTAMGLHPSEVNETSDDDLRHIVELARAGADSYVAIGEIGLDLYWDKTFERKQMEALETQLKLARELDKPVIIHCREALDQTLEVMSAFSDLQGVFHCFCGTTEDVEKIRTAGLGHFFYGIGGVVTFKNSKLRNVLPEIGIDHILLETDSPYLAPVPHRGKRNESAFLVHTAACVADALGLSLDAVAEKTNSSASALFFK